MFATLAKMFILILHTPDVDVWVGAYDTFEDCDEVAYVMGRHLDDVSYVDCVAEDDA